MLCYSYGTDKNKIWWYYLCSITPKCRLMRQRHKDIDAHCTVRARRASNGSVRLVIAMQELNPAVSLKQIVFKHWKQSGYSSGMKTDCQLSRATSADVLVLSSSYTYLPTWVYCGPRSVVSTAQSITWWAYFNSINNIIMRHDWRQGLELYRPMYYVNETIIIERRKRRKATTRALYEVSRVLFCALEW